MKFDTFSVQLVRESTVHYEAKQIRDPAGIYEILCDKLNLDKKLQEELHIIYFNSKMKPIGSSMISKGGLASCACSPREIFAPAIVAGAYAVVMAHNHPSGDPYPSDADLEATVKAIKAGKIVGIEVVDHIVVGASDYCSLREIYPDMFKE